MECCRDFLANNYSDMGEPNVTAFNMAIKALEQKPCTDAISRSAVIEMIKYMDNNGFVTRSVNHVVDDIRTLPSVTPTRKIGKWKDCGEREPWYRCSECQEKTWGSYKKYCPNCGAEMECD